MALAVHPGHRLLIPVLIALLALLDSEAQADLVISRADRTVDLTSHIVRCFTSLKIENTGPDAVSQVLLAFPSGQANNLAALRVLGTEGKGKGQSLVLHAEVVQPEGVPAELTFYAVSLAKDLEKKKTINLEVLAVFTNTLQPFPAEITQAEPQLLLYQDSAYFVSPYSVKVQTLAIRLPGGRIESYTKYPNTKVVESELRYGPFEDTPALSYAPLGVHYENNYPFAVARELVREIEISHWGNIQITEHYSIAHAGAKLKDGFSRIDFQGKPYQLRGISSFSHLVARLPPSAHSIYYRDDIGNISTSHMMRDSKKTHLAVEPRFPLFGGWKTTFTVGYGVPLKDFLYEYNGKRLLNITFGSPMEEIHIENLVIKVVLPEGSHDIDVLVPFTVEQQEEVKHSHLDTVGRPVVILQKRNVVAEHNAYFQVTYKFTSISLLREPLMLVTGFFLLFAACIAYVHTDLSISKNSASYLAKLQRDEVQAIAHRILNIFNQYLAVHDKLEASLRDLSRAGDVQACKAARKAADAQFKELAKELKPMLTALQSFPQSSQIYSKVEELVNKEKELQEKLMARHVTVVDSFEKKLRGQDVENRIASQQQKIATLRQEVDALIEYISEI